MVQVGQPGLAKFHKNSVLRVGAARVTAVTLHGDFSVWTDRRSEIGSHSFIGRVEFEQDPAQLLFKMVKVQFDGGLVREIHHAGSCDSDSHHDGIADLFLGDAKFQRLAQVTFQTTLTPGRQ